MVMVMVMTMMLMAVAGKSKPPKRAKKIEEVEVINYNN